MLGKLERERVEFPLKTSNTSLTACSSATGSRNTGGNCTSTHVSDGFESARPDSVTEEMEMLEDKLERVFQVRPETSSKTTEKPETTYVTQVKNDWLR